MIHEKFWIYLLVTAGVTYLVRMIPLVAMKGKITNPFLLSFLHYIPYAVLSVMTVPAMFYASEHILPAAAGFAVAVIFSWRGGSLVKVAVACCAAVLLLELMM